MASSASEKISRSSGKFVPDQGMVGYLLGKKCQALHTLAKECEDGVFINYNNQTKCFDIQARSVSGVRKAINKLKTRQAEGQKEKLEWQEQESMLVQEMVASVVPAVSVASVASVAPSTVRRVVSGPVPWTPMMSLDQNGRLIGGMARLETSMQIPEGWEIESATIKLTLVSKASASASASANWAVVPAVPTVPTVVLAPSIPSIPSTSSMSVIGKAHPALSAPNLPMLGKPVTATRWGDMQEQLDQGATMTLPDPESILALDGGSSSDDEELSETKVTETATK